MISQPMFLIGSLLLCAGLCNGACETSYEDVFTVDCSFSYLREVPLEEIPDEVQSLDLSNNELTKLKRSQWKSYAELETLYFTDNYISEIEEDAFSDLKKLSNLDLSTNKLHHIPSNIFSENRLIQYVKFSDNPGLYLPPHEPFLISMVVFELDISSCHLTSLYPETFSKLNLTSLDLSNNNLETIDKNIFSNLINLNSLDLRNNKWNCDCEIVEVLNMVSKRRADQNLQVEFSHVRCLQGGMFKKLWTASSLNKICEFETERVTTNQPERAQVLDRLEKKEEIIKQNLESSKLSNTEYPVNKNKINIIGENPPFSGTNELQPKQDGELLSTYGRVTAQEEFRFGNTELILLFCVLPVSLGISVFVTLFIIFRCTNWFELRK